VIGPYSLLKLWVGHDYAVRGALFLQVLVLGNIVRQLASPYALVMLATGKQHLATIAAVAEALVNLCLSIYLVRKYGAIGVAIGTLVGAFVSIGLHLTVSMKLTQSAISMWRRSFVLTGLLRPLLCVIPAAFLIPLWKHLGMFPLGIPMILTSFFAMAVVGWFAVMTAAERNDLRGVFHRLVFSRFSRT
jgi:O-antigen/teichoic acid export membrane protein